LGGPPPQLGCALGSLGQSLARVKISGRSSPIRAEILYAKKVHFSGSKLTCNSKPLVDQSSPDFTGLFSSNAGGILLVRTSFRFRIRCRVPEIFAVKVGSGPKLTEILHVFGPQIFWGSTPPNFWSGIIKFSQVLIMWQSFRAIGRGSSETDWQNKKKHLG